MLIDTLPIDVGIRGHVTIPGDTHVVRAPHIFPTINGHHVRGVQRLIIRDETVDTDNPRTAVVQRVMEFHVHPRTGNYPIEGASSDLHAEVRFDFEPEDPAGTIELIDGHLTLTQHEGRDVWAVTGTPV